MGTASLPQLQMETPPLDEHPTGSENLQMEEEDDSGNRSIKKRHLEATSDIDEDDDSDNETREKLHFAGDSDIDEAVPMLKDYYQEVEETEGYGVTFTPNVLMLGQIFPLNEDTMDRDIHLERVDECVKYAINRFNKQEGVVSLEYVELVHVTYYFCGGITYNISFKAMESSGECRVYQTKVFRRQLAYRPLCMIVRQFRVKPEAGKQPEEYNLSPSEEELKNIRS